MNIRLLRISLMLGVGLMMLAAAADTSLEWRTFELCTREGGNSQAYGLSSRGTVGAELMPGGMYHAVLWRNETTASEEKIDLGTLGGKNSYAYSISDASTGDLFFRVVGKAQTAGGKYHAILWQAFQRIDLGTLGGAESEARSVNNNVQIAMVAGSAQTADGSWHAAYWERPDGASHITRRDLGTLGGHNSAAYFIAADRTVLGWAETGRGIRHAALWRYDSVHGFHNVIDLDAQPMLATAASEARAVNSIRPTGIIVGASQDDDGIWRATIWKKKDPKVPDSPYIRTQLDTEKGRASFGNAINSSGDVVGWLQSPAKSGPRRAFFYDAASPKLLDLTDQTTKYSPGWILREASAVWHDKTVAGSGERYRRPRAFYAVPLAAYTARGRVDRSGVHQEMVRGIGSVSLRNFPDPGRIKVGQTVANGVEVTPSRGDLTALTVTFDETGPFTYTPHQLDWALNESSDPKTVTITANGPGLPTFPEGTTSLQEDITATDGNEVSVTVWLDKQ
jgi:probable HAF family extracellular repeat protein